MGRTPAVLVGVPDPGSFGFLGKQYAFHAAPGVLEDIAWYEEFIRAVVGDVDLTVLNTPERTTAPQILEAVRDAARAVLAGETDTIFLALVGHGFQVPDHSGDEEDGWDEVFAATGGPVVDDDFAAIWARLPQRARIVSFVDTCSSDSIAIAAVEPEWDTHLFTGKPGPFHLSLSAARQGQDARPTRVPHGGGVRGVMSLALQEAWEEAGGEHTTYLEWFEDAARRVSTMSDQVPVLRYLGPDRSLLDERPFS